MRVYNIDLHYHAGQEREEGTVLRDYFVHARLTDRKILGVTDHLGRYTDPEKACKARWYAPTLEGLERFRSEVDALKTEFPDIFLLFGPEIGPDQDLCSLPGRIVEVSDFFIFEPFARLGDDIAENTQAFVKRVEEAAEFMDETQKPGFIAHPFRASVNRRLIKRDIEQWVRDIDPGRRDFCADELGRFFLLDIDSLNSAVSRLGIPLEINGNTHFRIRSSNLPAPLNMLWRAYEILLAGGAEFVPGSDQHGFNSGVGRIGQYVPYDCFEALGLSVSDIPFLRSFSGTPAVN